MPASSASRPDGISEHYATYLDPSSACFLGIDILDSNEGNTKIERHEIVLLFIWCSWPVYMV